MAAEFTNEADGWGRNVGAVHHTLVCCMWWFQMLILVKLVAHMSVFLNLAMYANCYQVYVIYALPPPLVLTFNYHSLSSF